MKQALVLCLAVVGALLLAQAPAPRPMVGRGPQPPVRPKPEELEQVKSKTEQLESLVRTLKAKHADAALTGDVEVYSKAGRFLLEFPDQFFTQNGINHAIALLNTGLERAQQLQHGQAPWNTGHKQTHAYYSAMDGSVQPYGITLPALY